MSEIYRTLLHVHIVSASLALATFWGAVLARKGGRLHRRSGRGFVATMGFTAATAAVLCAFLLADPLEARPPGPEIAYDELGQYVRTAREIGGGLLELSLATGSLLHFGVRALRRRRGVPLRERRSDLALAGAAIAAGLLLFGAGLDPRFPHFEGKGVLLSVIGAFELRSLLRRPRSRAAWLVQHLVGLLGAGAIAHGALATNVALVFTDDFGTAFEWGARTAAVFGAAIAWTARRWKGRLEGAGRPAALEGALSARPSRA